VLPATGGAKNLAGSPAVNLESPDPNDPAKMILEEVSMANDLGKRYVCPNCGSNVLCTKGGEGEIQCCDTEMELQQPRKLPSSD
jgi:predicted RNA-binding Zn-ribbon protein involved in translation (DUF1610 family)